MVVSIHPSSVVQMGQQQAGGSETKPHVTMRLAAATLALAAVAAVATALSTANVDSARFSSFVARFNKTYTGAEKEARFAIFQSNLRKSERWNLDEGEEVFGITKFSVSKPSGRKAAGGQATCAV